MTRALFERAAMLAAMIVKELRQTVRDRRMMALLIVAPIVQLIMFGFAVNLDVDEVPTVVVDHDRSHLSAHHQRRLFADRTLVLVATTDDDGAAQQMLETGEAAVVLVFPDAFERDVTRGRPATVQVVMDGTDPNRANVVAAAVSGYFAKENTQLARDALVRAGANDGAAPLGVRVDMRSRYFFNPALTSAIYMVPGVSAILLMLITTVVAAMGLTREREDGTLDQIMVTPSPNWVVIAGKILPFVAFGFFDFAVAMVVGAYLFDMPVVGSPVLLVVATALYLLVTLGMGLLIATSSHNQQQAFMGGFIFMLPATLLSGIMTPVESMPAWMQSMTVLNPLRHYAEVLRGVLLRGSDASDLSVPLAALAAMGVVLFGTATYRFSKTLE